MRSIFIVDEEKNIRFTIAEYLTREGYKVETFFSPDDVLLRLESGFPDMFILDLMLSGQEGLAFCQDIKMRSGIPVIFLFAHGKETERIQDLQLENEDYLTKPFSPRELVTRVRSIFRRYALPMVPEKNLEIGNLRIKPNDHHTSIDDQEIMLTPMEYELLLLLARQPQRCFNRQELLDRIWGCDYVGDNRAVDSLVKRLRKKLRENGSSKNVKTIWGYGYRFEE